MDARFFDVFLNAGNDTCAIISQSINVELRSLLQEFVDQDRPIVREIYRRAHVFIETVFIVNDRHRAPAQNVAGPHQYWIAHAFSDRSEERRVGKEWSTRVVGSGDKKTKQRNGS